LAERKSPSPERKLSCFSENTPESTLAPGTFSPGRHYSHLGENTSSFGRMIYRLGKNILESTLAPGAFSLGEIILA